MVRNLCRIGEATFKQWYPETELTEILGIFGVTEDMFFEESLKTKPDPNIARRSRTMQKTILLKEYEDIMREKCNGRDTKQREAELKKRYNELLGKDIPEFPVDNSN